MTGASYESHHVDVVVVVVGGAVGRSGKDTRTFGWCEKAVLIRYDGDGSQAREARLW